MSLLAFLSILSLGRIQVFGLPTYFSLLESAVRALPNPTVCRSFAGKILPFPSSLFRDLSATISWIPFGDLSASIESSLDFPFSLQKDPEVPSRSPQKKPALMLSLVENPECPSVAGFAFRAQSLSRGDVLL